MFAIRGLVVSIAAFAAAQDIHLTVRSRVQPFKNSQEWTAAEVAADFAVKQTAVLICDMWDNHWCKGAAGRVDILARKMAPVIDRARAGGIQIIHAPSEVMD